MAFSNEETDRLLALKDAKKAELVRVREEFSALSRQFKEAKTRGLRLHKEKLHKEKIEHLTEVGKRLLKDINVERLRNTMITILDEETTEAMAISVDSYFYPLVAKIPSKYLFALINLADVPREFHENYNLAKHLLRDTMSYSFMVTEFIRIKKDILV